MGVYANVKVKGNGTVEKHIGLKSLLRRGRHNLNPKDEHTVAKKMGEIGIGPKVLNMQKTLTGYKIKMEQLEGTYEQLNAEEATSVKTMKSIVKLLLDLHKMGYCHGDIHWQNVMYTKDKKFKLIDFGKAKKIGTNKVDYSKVIEKVKKSDYSGMFTPSAPNDILRLYYIYLIKAEQTKAYQDAEYTVQAELAFAKRFVRIVESCLNK